MLRYSPPRHGRLEATETLEVTVAGAESNLAAVAARLGVDAVWLSKLPETPLGRRITNALAGYGVDTKVVWTDSGRTGVYYVEPGAAPRGTHVFYDRSHSAFTTLQTEELHLDSIARAEMFAMSGITPALSTVTAETTRELLHFASEHDTKTIFDLNYRSRLWTPDEANAVITDLLPAVDVFVLGEESARSVLDQSGNARAIVDDLIEKWEFEAVILTRGSWGAVARTPAEYIEQRAFEAETIDPIGTGDAFVGGLLTALLDGDPLPRALEVGAATAALKRTIVGDVALVTPAEVQRVIEEGNDAIHR